MGARWAWAAVCTNGHVYTNFSGGADNCYECDAYPEIVFDGDGYEPELKAYLHERKLERSQLSLELDGET